MIYQSPDIRKQTIEEAEAHIAAKRVRRMIVISSYQEKLKDKLGKLKGKELETFEKRKARADAAIAKATEALDRAASAVANLTATHNNLVNIENEEVRL